MRRGPVLTVVFDAAPLITAAVPIGLGLIVLGCLLLADPATPAWILGPS